MPHWARLGLVLVIASRLHSTKQLLPAIVTFYFNPWNNIRWIWNKKLHLNCGLQNSGHFVQTLFRAQYQALQSGGTVPETSEMRQPEKYGYDHFANTALLCVVSFWLYYQLFVDSCDISTQLTQAYSTDTGTTICLWNPKDMCKIGYYQTW